MQYTPRPHPLFWLSLIIFLLVLSVGGVLWWMQYSELTRWDNVALGDGHWLHPNSTLIKSAEYVEIHEARTRTARNVSPENFQIILNVDTIALTPVNYEITMPEFVRSNFAFLQFTDPKPDSRVLSPTELLLTIAKGGTAFNMQTAQPLSSNRPAYIRTVTVDAQTNSVPVIPAPQQ